MVTTDELTSDIGHVEFHDGSLEAIRIEKDQLLLSFAEVFAYREIGIEKFSIEKCRATLTIMGPREIKLMGSLGQHAWVADCDLTGSDGSNLSRNLLSGTGEGKLNLSLDNGMTVEAGFRRAVLELHGPLEPFETWDGPLVSDN